MTGEFPDAWKIAKIKPLYRNKSKLEVINYRPVSLLPVISKILEQLANLRFDKFMRKHDLWYEGLDNTVLGKTGDVVMLELI